MTYAPLLRHLQIIVLFLSVCSGCKKNVATPPPADVSGSAETLRLAKPITVTADCNYVFNEGALAGWTKVFEDDFTSDLSKWNIWTGGAYNNELQHYQAANLSIANGILSITAKKENVTGSTTPGDATPKNFQYTSGRIECKTPVSANATTPKVRLSARIKLPTGYGMWPAFWSYGDPWPTQGEIDIVEARGQEPFKYQNNYFYGNQPGRNLVRNATGYFTANIDLTTCYHVYELVWEQNKLLSYLDGVLIETKTSGGYIDDMFGKNQRITLNLAVGGNFFTNLDPAKITMGTLQVDWVKVFTSN